MTKTTQRKLADLGERLFWTFVQGGLAVISVEAFDLPYWAVPPIAAALSAVKSAVASQVNNTTSVSTLPKTLDPAGK